MGLSSLMTLFVICFMASICAVVGIWADISGVAESTMFIAFLILFTIYFCIMSYIWRITKWILSKNASIIIKKQNDRA